MLPEKCMARTVAPFFYKRTSAVLREAEAAAATATAATAASASKSSKKSSRAVHPDSDRCTCNSRNCNGCVTVTAVPSPLEAHCSSSISGDIETGDTSTSTTGSCSSSDIGSTAADSAATTTAAAAAVTAAATATTIAETADTAADTATTAGTAVSAAATSGPVFDNSVGLLQTPQAFYNLDSQDLLGQVSVIIALRSRVRNAD
jgi:hypothetical protein